MDVVQRVAEFPAPDQKITSLDAELVTGGPAAGAAITAAALGSPVSLMTALGRHPIGGLVATDLTQHGVQAVDIAPHRESAPPISAVSVHDATGQRCVVSRNAADGDSDVSDTDFPVGIIDDAAVLLADGHYPALALATVRRAKAAGVPVLLDGGSWKPVLAELLPYVDFAVCSAAFRAPGTTTSAEQGPALRALGVPVVAVTQGGGPVLCWDSGQGVVPDEIPVPQVRVADTLGAGDVFHGAVAHAMRATTKSCWLHTVVSFAASVAALRVEHRGRRNWLAALQDRDELQKVGE